MDARASRSRRPRLTRLNLARAFATNVEDGPLDAVASDLAPFAVASVLAAILVPIGQSVRWTEYIVGVALMMLSGATRIHGLRLGRPWSGELPPALIFLLGVAVMRQAAGVLDAGVAILALLPVFWTALHGNQRQLWGVIGGVAVFFFAPMLLIGGTAYPAGQYRAGLMYLVVSAIIGMTTQRLVLEVRRQARHAQGRERMLERVAEVVRGLSGSHDARAELCRAAREIAGADFAMLCEPEEIFGRLRVSAFADGQTIIGDGTFLEIDPREGSAIRDAFVAGQTRLWRESQPERVFTEDVHLRLGSPMSALLEPIFKSGETIGVLVVGWLVHPETMRSKTSGVGLLAHEIAVAIERADAFARIVDQAKTDALTGLPNRRAWDQALARALEGSGPVVVAMLDFDHFKDYNDSCGHPAGDRLLKETAAAWRDELRGGDLLARLGGEEFALLMTRTPVKNVAVVVDRLRDRMPYDQTCSAGIVICGPHETPTMIMARVDEALYDAKRRGRNRWSFGAQTVASPTAAD